MGFAVFVFTVFLFSVFFIFFLQVSFGFFLFFFLIFIAFSFFEFVCNFVVGHCISAAHEGLFGAKDGVVLVFLSGLCQCWYGDDMPLLESLKGSSR